MFPLTVVRQRLAKTDQAILIHRPNASAHFAGRRLEEHGQTLDQPARIVGPAHVQADVEQHLVGNLVLYDHEVDRVDGPVAGGTEPVQLLGQRRARRSAGRSGVKLRLGWAQDRIKSQRLGQ